MLHLLASFAFMLVSAGAVALIAAMLLQEQTKILAALGVEQTPVQRPARQGIRVRTAGRWQAASAPAARPWRAAA